MDEITDKREYEMSYLLVSDIAEDKLETEKEELSKTLLQNGGTVGELDMPAKKRLAYPIKKQTQAYFGTANFKMTEENLEALKKAMTFNKKYLRFLIVNKPAVKAKLQVGTPLENAPLMPESFEQKLESILKR